MISTTRTTTRMMPAKRTKTTEMILLCSEVRSLSPVLLRGRRPCLNAFREKSSGSWMEIVGDRKPVLIADLLCQALPFEVMNRASSKYGIAKTFVKSWAILSGIVANKNLGRELSHQLESYLSLMGRLELTAEHVICEADEVDRNGKSIRLTGSELHWTMLNDCATKPIPAMSSCAKCGHCLVETITVLNNTI